jgi:hypothetical protein
MNAVLRNFPKFELCYENITHKKVLNPSVILAIPEGNKCFAWFTKSTDNDDICYLLEMKNKRIVNVQHIDTCFTDKLSLGTGTIFYGTWFVSKNMHYYCVEDLYFHSGKYCGNYPFLSKLDLLKRLFQQDILQTALSTKFTVFGMPLMATNLRLLIKDIDTLPYKVGQIKFRFFGNDTAKKIVTMNYFKPGTQMQKEKEHPIREAVFNVSPDIEPDIYKLFAYKQSDAYKQGTEEYVDVAFIPDYKTSVFMNGLFRNIKENINLDAIEESDDEDDFENTNYDKYVYLSRSLKMKCVYNNKFKKWVPVSLAEKDAKIINIGNIYER